MYLHGQLQFSHPPTSLCTNRTSLFAGQFLSWLSLHRPLNSMYASPVTLGWATIPTSNLRRIWPFKASLGVFYVFGTSKDNSLVKYRPVKRDGAMWNGRHR